MTVIEAIHKAGRLVFSTREIAQMTGASVGSVTQSLRRLEKQGVIKKIIQGVWGFVEDKRFSPFLVIPYLNQNHRSYLSFISALHVYDAISQIPQVITVASTAHTKVFRTSVGAFHVHQISPDFFDGFDWHKTGDYLMATPEKAFVDCLYLASRRSKYFGHFPELDISMLDAKKVKAWVGRIKDSRLRKSVMDKAVALKIY